MQSCSIRGCQSYKTIQTKPVAYFKFPFHHERLLKAWLMQINQENFSPTSQDQICSTHFLIEDIEPSSIGRYPVLKPDAVPTVFPERKDNLKDTTFTKPTIIKSEIKSVAIKSPTLAKFETILIPDFSNTSGIPIRSKSTIMQAKPTITPQKVVQLSTQPGIQGTPIISAPIQIQSRGLQIQSKPIQIQPKPIQIQKIQFHPNIQLQGKPQIVQFQGKQFQIQQSPIPIQQQSPIQIQQSPIPISQNTPIRIPLNSAIQIQQAVQPNGKLIPLKQINAAELKELLANSNKNVATKQVGAKTSILKSNVLGKKISESNASLTSSSPGNKKPVLKIQINKLNDEGTRKKGVTRKENATKVIRTKPEEVQIKALNKSVIFRLEPSGKIVVETVETKGGEQKVVKNVEPQITNRTIVQKPVEVEVEMKELNPKLVSLKNLYNRAHEDCEKLSKKLAALKQRHQEEQEQILKLQEHLTGLNKKVETTYDSDISGSSVSKKRKVISQKEEEDEYEKLLREVRKIKQDYDKNVSSKPSKNEAVNIKVEKNSLENDARELEDILTQDQTINTTAMKREKNRKKIESKKIPPVIENVVMPEGKKYNVIKRKKIEVPKREINVQKIDAHPSKFDGEIIGLIDENEGGEFSDDEMNYEAEYLDPEFMDC